MSKASLLYRAALAGLILSSHTVQASIVKKTESLTFNDLETLVVVASECEPGFTLKSSFARVVNRNIVVHSIDTRNTNQGRKSTIRLKRIANQNDLSRIINNNPITPITADVELGSICDDGVDVTAYGATGDGSSDDTQAIRRAINAAPAGGTVYFPRGNYRVTGPLSITKRLTIIGDGFSSQLFQAATDKHLFNVNQARAVRIADLFLGSAGIANNASLIRLDRAHYSRVERVAMGGGVNGIRELGSIGVIYEDLKTVQGMAQPGYFALAELSSNQVWYLSRPQTQTSYIASNATMLINPILRAGQRGISIIDSAAQGNHMIIGGIIEANADIGLRIQGNGQPISVLGTHFEANGTDIQVNAGNNISFDGILSTGKTNITGNSTDVSFQNAMLNRVYIADTAVRTSLINTITDLDAGPTPHLVNDAEDTLFVYAGTARSRLSKARSTIGVGTDAPPNNQQAPMATVNVDGRVYASEGFEPAPNCPSTPDQCPVDPEPPLGPEGHYYTEIDELYPGSGRVYVSAVAVDLGGGNTVYDFNYEDDRDSMSDQLELGDPASLRSNCCDTVFDITLVSATDTELVLEGTRYLLGVDFPQLVNITIPRGTTNRSFDCAEPLICFVD